MKAVFINASPRKKHNTWELLQSAQKGAEAAGAETEFIDLYDLDFKGCRGCLLCKLKDAERCKCYFKDDLSPVIEKILGADVVVFGTPIFMGEATSGFRALYERLGFCVLSYDGMTTYFKGKINIGIIYTMNATKEFFEANMQKAMKGTEFFLGAFFGGEVRTYAACDTLQVGDYSKYSMGMFDEAHKKAWREEQFPKDLEEAYKLGEALCIK